MKTIMIIMIAFLVMKTIMIIMITFLVMKTIMIIMITFMEVWNVVFAMKERGVPESVFQNVVVDFAGKKEILEEAVVDAVADVKILKLHMSYEWTNATPIDVKYFWILSK